MDEELIRLIAERQDQDAFRVLYARHTAAVYGLLCRLVGRAGDASDLMQETWLRAVRHLALFRGQSAFRTWLTGIALNCYREWRRRHAREMPVPSSGVLRSQGSTGDDIAAVHQILACLAPEHREVIVLHDIEDTRTKRSPPRSRSRRDVEERPSRARRTFRERWRATVEPQQGRT
jgi:RNA polymerase sigma-70 factor (ECF subfamily)